MSNDRAAQLSMASAEPRYHPVGDTQRLLYDVVEDFRTKRIQVPEFQRASDVWDKRKQRQYVEALESGPLPIGVIVTCQIDGDERLWLIDGLQRLNSLLELITSPKEYGNTAKTAEDLLRSITVTRQHRRYDSMVEALEWFQRINLGAALTNYEFYKGYLTLLEDYDKVILPELEKIHKAVDQARSSLGIKEEKDREKAHKALRHDYVLFYRFATNGLDNLVIDMSNTKKQDNERAVEKLVSNWIRDSGVQQLRKNVNSFASVITNHAALLHDIWPEVSKGDRNRTINYTLYRWLLEIDITRRSLNRSESDYEQFVKQLWELWATDPSNSAARFPASANGGRPLTVNLGKAFIQASALARQLGSNFAEKKTRQKRTPQLVEARLGMQEGHEQPFATHGEGATQAEPASRNMARGAKPIENK